MAYKHDYDKTLFRLNTILSRLNDGEALSVKELAEEFNVSERTIQRDFNNRLVNLYPIYQEKRLWRMKKGFKLEKQNSSEEDLILGILDKMVEGMGNSFSAKAKHLLAKIHNQDENPIFVKANMEDISSHMGEIEVLKGAISSKIVTIFVYTKDGDTPKKRRVKPLKIVTYEGFWYLVALNENDEIRKFYLKNIINIHVGDEIFTVDVNINTLLEESISIWFNAKSEAFNVTLLADAKIAKYFKRKPLPTQEIEEERDDGSLLFSLNVTNEVEVMNLVKCRLPHLRVIEPLWIKDKIDDELKSFLGTE